MNIQETTIQAATKRDRLVDASVELVDCGGNSILISEIRILRKKNGQLCIAMPSRSVNHWVTRSSIYPTSSAAGSYNKRSKTPFSLRLRSGIVLNPKCQWRHRTTHNVRF